MSDQYYIRSRGKVQGPFTAEALRTLGKRRKFGRSFQVSTDQLNWAPATEYPDLLPKPRERKVRAKPVEEPVPQSGADQSEDAQANSPALQQAEVKQSAVPASVAAADSQWYYALDDQPLGPVSFEELRILAEHGKLTDEHFVWSDGLDDWVEAERVPGLLSPAAEPEDDSARPQGTTSAGSGAALSPLAVASLILGLLGTNFLFGIGSVAAVICGHLALIQIRSSGNALSGRRMAIAGLVLGYLVPALLLLGLALFGLLKAVGVL